MNESGLSKKVMSMKGALLRRIEDSVQDGTPDVYYNNKGDCGWIELKYREEYPKRPGTPIKFKHFTLQQLDFLITNWEQGGRSRLLAQVDRDYYIFSDKNIVPIYNGATKLEFIEYCDAHWSKRLNLEELKGCL